MNEEEAIKNVKEQLEGIKKANECGLATKGEFNKDIEAIESVLNLLEKKAEEIEKYKMMLAENCARTLNSNLKQKHKHEEDLEALHLGWKEEIEKKDKIINSIKEYAQQEIDFATEDIEDYIDDDREGNKDIIGELKEWREHWKDIIRIMNNEKTYIDFEYKVEEDK